MCELSALGSAVSPVHAQAPSPQHPLIAALRPSGQNRLHAGKDVDGHYFRWFLTLGTYHYQGLTRTQFAEIKGRRSFQHLLYVERLIARIPPALALGIDRRTRVRHRG